MTAPIRLYGAEWCADCHRAREFLTRRQVPFEWVDVDQDEEAVRTVELLSHGSRRLPTLAFPDGSVLVEPSDADLARKLGLVA